MNWDDDMSAAPRDGFFLTGDEFGKEPITLWAAHMFHKPHGRKFTHWARVPHPRPRKATETEAGND